MTINIETLKVLCGIPTEVNFEIGIVKYPKEVDSAFPKLFIYKENNDQGVLCWVTVPKINSCCDKGKIKIGNMFFSTTCSNSISIIHSFATKAKEDELRLQIRAIPSEDRTDEIEKEYLKALDKIWDIRMIIRRDIWINICSLGVSMGIKKILIDQNHDFVLVTNELPDRY